jgi:SET domain-containing protein
MMLVETELRPSAIHGLGVFLLQHVQRNELIWRFDSRIDRVYTPEEVSTLPDHVQRYLRTYSTWHQESGLYVLCGDNGRYFNHHATPTTISSGISFGEDRAARDLEPGDELTSDYRTICDRVRLDGEPFCEAEARRDAAE